MLFLLIRVRLSHVAAIYSVPNGQESYTFSLTNLNRKLIETISVYTRAFFHFTEVFIRGRPLWETDLRGVQDTCAFGVAEIEPATPRVFRMGIKITHSFNSWQRHTEPPLYQPGTHLPSVVDGWEVEFVQTHAVHRATNVISIAQLTTPMGIDLESSA